MLLDPLFVHPIQRLQGQLKVLDQRIAPTPREILPHDDPHQLQFLTMRCHRIRRYYPSSLPQLVRHSELIIMVPFTRIQAKRHKR